MPSPSSDKAPSNLFFHLRQLVQLDDTTWSHMQPISCQYFIFNTDISCRLLFVLLSICSWHKRGDIMQLPSRLPNVSIKNYSRTRLSIDIDRSVGRSRGREEISLLGILRLICVCLSQQSSDWQAIQLRGSKKKRKTIIISIISPSPAFLRRSFALMI